jgi:hypothetical protein
VVIYQKPPQHLDHPLPKLELQKQPKKSLKEIQQALLGGSAIDLRASYISMYQL